MTVPQSMNTLAGFHSSSIICHAIKLLMEDLRDTRQVHPQIHLELIVLFFFSLSRVLLLTPENKIPCYKNTLTERSFINIPASQRKCFWF